MPAPQQSQVSVYKDVASIPRPNTAYYQHNPRNSTGHALGELLGATPKAIELYGDAVSPEDEEQSKMEKEQLAALASVGASRDRLRLAGGGGFFGIAKDPDASLDAYELNRGRREADLLSGQMRDAYAEAGLYENDDPRAFQEFAESYRTALFSEHLEGSDASYQHGFLTRIAPVFEDMAKTHAGHLDTFIPSKTKEAAKQRIGQKINLDLTIGRQDNATSNFLDTIALGESGGNYNAYSGNAKNTSERLTSMSLDEVIQWQKGWKGRGSKSSAVGKYQFISKTFQRVAREMGLDLKKTKFTPAVQDSMAAHVIMTSRGGQKFLDGKISAEDFLDKHLRKEWAALKGTDGKGFYDGDGLNKGSTSPKKMLASILAWREAYIKDPKSFKDSKGKIALSSDNTSPLDLEGSEEELGITQAEAREAAADSVISFMEEHPEKAEDDDWFDGILDKTVTWLFGSDQKSKVVDRRARIKQEQRNKKAVAAEKASKDRLTAASSVLYDDDDEHLESLKSSDRDLYTELLTLRNTPEVNPELTEAGDEFINGLDFSSNKDIAQEALSALQEGQIDRRTYKSAIDWSKEYSKAKKYLESPAIKRRVSKMVSSLGGELSSDFMFSAISSISGLIPDDPEQPKPSLQAVFTAVQETYSVFAQELADEEQELMNKYSQASPHEAALKQN